MNIQDIEVYGERLADLVPALHAMEESMTIDEGGRYRMAVTLEPADAAPLRRALLRAQAELMEEEAALIGSPLEQDRTHDERAADALVRIAEAIRDGR